MPDLSHSRKGEAEEEENAHFLTPKGDLALAPRAKVRTLFPDSLRD